jgi:AbrB family looped-hinge helix DNA binding protein
MTLTISNKGWVVIPVEFRKKYNLQPGSKVVIVDYGGVLAIVPAVKDPINKGYGFLKDSPSLYDTLKKERELEKKREERFINGG